MIKKILLVDETNLDEVDQMVEEELDKKLDIAISSQIDAFVPLIGQAVKTLTDKQKLIFYKHVFLNQSTREISQDLLLDRRTVRDHYDAALKNIKRFYINYKQELIELLSVILED